MSEENLDKTIHTILVVDDSKASIELMETLLTSRGYDVVSASSGPDALHVLQLRPVDLIVLDMNMPEMNGLETCRQIRMVQKLRHVPVLFLTAESYDPRLIAQAFDAGGNDYLSKPVRSVEFIARVRAALRVYHMHLELEVMRKNLSKFVSKQARDLIKQSGPEEVRLGGRRETIVTLFSDIRGFTSFSEKLEPEDVIEVLNLYLTAQAELVEHHGGSVCKYSGDEVMAIFQGEDAAKEAIRCAVNICSRLTSLGQIEDRATVRVGIGISSGPAIVGTIGSRKRMDYTAIGDTVNLAARLCGSASPFQILVSANTVSQVPPDTFQWKKLPPIRVKGKANPVEVYEITDKT